MANETPGTHLARLRVQHPGWRFWRGDSTGEFWAAPPAGFLDQRLVSAPDPVTLEARVVQAERIAAHDK